MEKEIMKKESIYSERAQKLYEKIQRVAPLPRFGIGGQMRGKKYVFFGNYKIRCWEYNVQMNPDGFDHAFILTDKITSVLWPVARASGLNVFDFTEERIDKIIEVIKNNKDWINATDQLHEDIIKETDEKLTVQIKKK